MHFQGYWVYTQTISRQLVNRMVNNNDNDTQDFLQLAEKQRQLIMENADDPIEQVERVYQLWWHWADFQIYVINPVLSIIEPPQVIHPEPVEGGDEIEFVYPIHDEGYKLSTSKAEEMYSAGKSMCKMHYTIEKMIFLLLERLKSRGVDDSTEVQVSFGGHELCQRKAFESIINLSYNVVVTNFDPGSWGERYLAMVRHLADKGYGYPPEAPRDVYRHSHQVPSKPQR